MTLDDEDLQRGISKLDGLCRQFYAAALADFKQDMRHLDGETQRRLLKRVPVPPSGGTVLDRTKMTLTAESPSLQALSFIYDYAIAEQAYETSKASGEWQALQGFCDERGLRLTAAFAERTLPLWQIEPVEFAGPWETRSEFPISQGYRVTLTLDLAPKDAGPQSSLPVVSSVATETAAGQRSAPPFSFKL